ncbi:hypothetical protein D3C72_1340590 [compost metagenome]
MMGLQFRLSGDARLGRLCQAQLMREKKRSDFLLTAMLVAASVAAMGLGLWSMALQAQRLLG